MHVLGRNIIEVYFVNFCSIFYVQIHPRRSHYVLKALRYLKDPGTAADSARAKRRRNCETYRFVAPRRIGNDKIEIIRIAEKIGTYETSCLPYEDCCTVFTPRHPAMHPKLDHVARAEDCLDIDGLVNACVEGAELIEL